MRRRHARADRRRRRARPGGRRALARRRAPHDHRRASRRRRTPATTTPSSPLRALEGLRRRDDRARSAPTRCRSPSSTAEAARCRRRRSPRRTELVDRIKAIKSEEEQALIRGTAALQDAVDGGRVRRVEPGRRDSDIAAVAQHRARSSAASRASTSAPRRRPASRPLIGNLRHLQHRVMRRATRHAAVENNGPGGHYAESGERASSGPRSERLLEEHRVRGATRARDGRAGCARACRPAEVFGEPQRWMREHGRPEERRLHCHGQGYDSSSARWSASTRRWRSRRA